MSDELPEGVQVTPEYVVIERLSMRLAQSIAANERLVVEVEMLNARLQMHEKEATHEQ